MNLGVNIDHICVLRAARAVNDPDIITGMYEAISGGADQITVHLREDRRHIDENDALNIIKLCKVPVNIECSIEPSIIDIICNLRPQRATIVPERRAELTTEGGLNLKAKGLKDAIKKLKENEIEISLFIDPLKDAIDATKELDCDIVELHTGAYANAFLMLNSNLSHTKYSIPSLACLDKNALKAKLLNELANIQNTAIYANKHNIKVAAGHGLNYQNVCPVAQIPQIFELNIGQSIIARSVFTGLNLAVKEMKALLRAHI